MQLHSVVGLPSAAFDAAAKLKWAVSIPVSQTSTIDAGAYSISDEMFKAIGQQWQN